MAHPARKQGESYKKYCARRKKENLDTRRALRGRPFEEGTYVGKSPVYIQAFDPKTGKIIVPVFWVKAVKGTPFRRGPNHPKVMAE